MAPVEPQVIRLGPNVTWREVDGEIVALHLLSSTYFSTNRTGAFLWHRIVDGISKESLAGRLVAEFGVADDQARVDVEKFVKLLGDNGLLEQAD